QFPPNWKAATPESLRAINDRMGSVAKAAILQQHPEMAGAIRFNAPKVVFYGSRRGEWDGQRLEIPSIRISAVPSRLDSVDIDAFQNLAEKMASASGMKLTGPLSEFRVNKHPFARADFERSVGATRMYQSYVQTVAGDYLLSIEIFAYSLEELQHVAASLQSIV